MKALLLARKFLIEIIREPQLLLLELLIPLFMLGLTYIGYSRSPRLPTHTVLTYSQNARAAEVAAPLLANLESKEYVDGRLAFQLEPVVDLDQAETQLKAGEASLLVLFSVTPGDMLQVNLRGDATSRAFIAASTLLELEIQPFLDREAGIPELVKFNQKPLETISPATDFDSYAPGMIVFAILLLIPQTAMLVGRELRWGTLRRLRLTSVRTWELLVGVTLAQMVIAIGQITIVFLAALALGFRNQGSIVATIGIGLLISLSSISLGLVVAGFCRNDSEALNIGSTVTMLQVFLSGAFFAMPPLTVFSLAGYEIGAFDFLPATHAMLILQQLLNGGVAWSSVGFRLAATSLLTLVYFFLGMVFFKNFQMRAARS
jgi:ABC-2 type transport system permease protein